jgi:hypothetical protein
MTQQEKVNAMIAWLTDHRDKFPTNFKLSKSELVVNAQKHIDVMLARLAAGREAKRYGRVFTAEYFHAYKMKRYYEENIGKNS